MNKRMRRILAGSLGLLGAFVVVSRCPAMSVPRIPGQAAAMPADLRCDDLENPEGIDDPQPALSWILDSLGRGHRQTAYEILVASSTENLVPGKADLWDSGKRDSSQSIQVAYAGKPLAARAFCYWKVRVWDADGAASAWSAPAHWTMGLLDATNWQATWIGLDTPSTNDSRSLPARWLRKEFSLPKGVTRASVYFCGLGWSELYLNGQKIGDHVLSPPLSQYPKRAYYETYEVTGHVKPGNNVIGVVLGDGRFYAPRTNAMNSGFPKLLLQLHVEFADGAATNIVSDETWKITTNGPIIANNEYDGEEYDARKEFPGWDKPGFDDSDWQPARIVSAPDDCLCGMRQEPTCVTQEIKPVAVTELRPGVYIFDMGQNMVGWCKIRVRGPAGTRITLRHAETLQSDGELFTNNLRSARATDVYILKGRGEEVWQPRFTLHGFRYVEMSGFPGRPTLNSLTGCVVGDDLPETGDFECSNPLLNKIYHNIVWGVRGNYRSIPTDCPQRDERQGWLGDRGEESRGEAYFFDNDDLYTKWLQDIADCQKADGSISSVCPTYWSVYVDDVTWASTSIIIPGTLRDLFGDERAVAAHYDCAKKWIEHMEGYITNGIIVRDSYGDWCMPPEDPKLIHAKDPARITHAALLATPFFYHDLRLMQSYARQLGKTNDAEQFSELAGQMKSAFNQKFLNRKTGEYDNGTPTSSILPLAFGMVPTDMHGKVFDFLVNKITGDWHSHVGTGVVGGKFLMRVLSANGRPDLAYTIATQTNYPGWGYMVEHDATTIWELWNGDTGDPAMNSGNHVMLIGDLATWMYEDLAGIKPDPKHPGFKHIIMRPMPIAGLTYVKASHFSPYGWITSDWRKDEGEFQWKIRIPANTTATVYLPSRNPEDVTESGRPLSQAKGVKLVGTEGGPVVVNVESGPYEFTCENVQ